MTYSEIVSHLHKSKEYRRIAISKQVNIFEPLYNQIEAEKSQSDIMCAGDQR